MGSALVSQLLTALAKLEWDGNPEATPAGLLVFRTVVDQVDGYRGDPRVLGLALRTARTADSLPYAYAAVAYILLSAAALHSTHGAVGAAQAGYDAAGLDAALAWLEKAQDLAPDDTEINVVEALIYICGERVEDARLVLDYLRREGLPHYLLLRAEMSYWQKTGDPSQALRWNERALQEAGTVPQRLRLKSAAAAIRRQAGDKAGALQAYKEALYFDENNGWLCHQIALLCDEQGALEEALRYNERALKLQPDFPEAQQLRERLSEKQRSSGLLGRLFG